MAGSGNHLELLCQSLGGELCAHVLPCLEAAAHSLELAAVFHSFQVVADDLPSLSDTQEPWLRLVESVDPTEKRLSGILFCSEESFCRPSPATSTVFPPVEIWDQEPAPRGSDQLFAERFSKSQADAFLHHELLWARDQVRGEIIPSDVPAGQVEGFASAWAVTVDGRLSRMGLPGCSMAVRRSRFSRLFSCAGVLLPGHWQIFQSLWDGGVADWKDVLACIRHLPRL